ncbi:hypothetical protein F01_260203 [Burkholderia cenocepacia]|nr:hypothetical protein F01_260203 [Burkholderia cenocepacia]
MKCSLASRHYKETRRPTRLRGTAQRVFRPLARVPRLPALHEVSLVIPLLPGACRAGHLVQFWVDFLTGYGGDDEESFGRGRADGCWGGDGARTEQRHAVWPPGRRP